ncbi:hypothetical protein, partial [Legionella santicrucis]
LGFSFAILRAMLGQAELARWEGGPGGFAGGVDLAAIEAIDGVRTKDLTQSLENLTEPSSLKVPKIRGN